MDFTLGTLRRTDARRALTFVTWKSYCQSSGQFVRGDFNRRLNIYEHRFPHHGEFIICSEPNHAVSRTELGAVIFSYTSGDIGVYYTAGARESAIVESKRLSSALELELQLASPHLTVLQQQALEVGEHLAVLTFSDGEASEVLLSITSAVSQDSIAFQYVLEEGAPPISPMAGCDITEIISIKKSHRLESEIGA